MKHGLFAFFTDPARVIHTEMMLVPDEFDNYQIGVDTDVTFCLKELRVNIPVSKNLKIMRNMYLVWLLFH